MWSYFDGLWTLLMQVWEFRIQISLSLAAVLCSLSFIAGMYQGAKLANGINGRLVADLRQRN